MVVGGGGGGGLVGCGRAGGGRVGATLRKEGGSEGLM